MINDVYDNDDDGSDDVQQLLQRLDEPPLLKKTVTGR